MLYQHLPFFPPYSVVDFPKMEVSQEYYGLPPPPVGFGQPLQLSKGDIIELTRADADLPWWEVTLKNKHIYLFFLKGTYSCIVSCTV